MTAEGFVAIQRRVLFDNSLSAGARLAWGVLTEALGHEPMPEGERINEKWLAKCVDRAASTEGYMKDLADAGLLVRVSRHEFRYVPLGYDVEIVVPDYPPTNL